MDADEIWDAIGGDFGFGYFPFCPPVCVDCKEMVPLKTHPDDKKLRCEECYTIKDENDRKSRLLTNGMW